MVFKEVKSQVSFKDLEEKILEFWQAQDTFRKSIALREGAPHYVFYEGPPTANGRPGIHHVLARVYKDTFPRYQTMKGKRVLRKGGWDCHGLPVEIEVEKELGFTGKGKQAIENYGVAEFNALCRQSVLRYVREWTKLSDRIAFWLDMDDPYVTMSNNYIESVWWILKQIWDKGMIYQGYKVVPYCARCGTPLSSHEVAQGYEDVQDPSVYVKFPLRDQPDVDLLVWTTTPWTLPANVAVAVGRDIQYVMVQQGDDKLILAKERLSALKGDYTVLKEMPGKELLGQHYRPLYNFLPVQQDYCYVIAGDFVTTADGTGMVHIAPAFGADDMQAGQENKLPVLQTVNLEGKFMDAVTPWRGLWVKDADPLIIEDLERRGLMYKVEQHTHSYPFCWRCDTPLLYYAKATWYIETTRMKQELVANNQKINWYPEHIKDGRFGDWLANNVDWALGRDRYWGTPLPVWKCAECGHQECVGGVAELAEKVGGMGRLPQPLDLHRPYIDAVTYRCEKCGGTMQRAPEVIDCWFDSGSMPVAQWHYPFENKEKFADQFPADFISEAIDQTRGWFYSLHAISTMLFNEPCFLNCISFGHVLDADGQKMSKSKGNVVNPWDVINLHGADAIRWYFYTASPPDYPRRFSADLVGETVRKFMLTLWNTYSFFVTYANIDKFDPAQHALPAEQRSALDRWALAEMHDMIADVDDKLAHYDMTNAARRIQAFVDDLSNWYVRRSRRRFWKSEEDNDKVAAYLTLYECLLTISKLLAPFTPFLAEELYQNLARSVDAGAPESVHLCDWPEADARLLDRQLIADTHLVMKLASLGLGARSQANLKVRQPLSEALVVVRTAQERESLRALADQLASELNVKKLGFADEASDLVSYQVSPKPREVGSKYKALYPKIKAKVASMDAADLSRRFRAGESVELEVEEQKVALAPEEVDVWSRPREGYTVAEESGYVVAISTALTDELVQEGLAREVVRRIQTMRKDADYRIEDTIQAWYEASPELERMFGTWGDYIKQETLCTALLSGQAPEPGFSAAQDIDEHKLTLCLLRNK